MAIEAFRREAVKGYEPIILTGIRDLVEQINEMSDKTVYHPLIFNRWGCATLFFFTEVAFLISVIGLT